MIKRTVAPWSNKILICLRGGTVVTLDKILGSLSVQVRLLPETRKRKGRQEMEIRWIEPIIETFDWPDILAPNDGDFEEFLQSLAQGKMVH